MANVNDWSPLEDGNTTLDQYDLERQINPSSELNRYTKKIMAAVKAKTDAIDSGMEGIDRDSVHKSGDETIAGTKTFSSPINGDVVGNVTGSVTGTAEKAVKDADGNEIASTYVKVEPEIRLYFNPHSSTLSDGRYDNIAGECNVIKIGDKVVMIDVGGDNRTASIKSYLSDIGVTKVDHLILSHYHGDHVFNLSKGNLLELDWSDCTIYLPSAGSSSSSEYEFATSTKATIEAYAAENFKSVVYPSEGDKLVFGNATLTFLNCGAAADAEIEANQLAAQTAGISTQTYPLNDYSTVVLLEYGGSKALYAGDIQYASEKRLCDNGLVGPVDLLKFPHHGSNSRNSLAYYLQFSDYVRAKYVVVQNGTSNDEDRPRLEEVNWGDDSVICLPRLEPTVFYCNASGISLLSTDHIADKVKNIVLDSGVNVLSPGDDLNDIVEAGTYTIMSADEASQMLHTPMTDNAGSIGNSKLIVMHGSIPTSVVQIIIAQNKNMFIRGGGSENNGPYTFESWSRLVKANGDETINGKKTFTSEIDVSQTSGTFLRVKNSGLTRGTTPNSNTNVYLPIEDSAGKKLGAMEILYYTSGEIRFSIYSFKGQSTDASNRIGVAYPASGDPFGFAPSTPTTGRDTDIVTRDYLNARLAAL